MEEIETGRWKRQRLGDGRDRDWEVEEIETGKWKRQRL
jgi:hypothetical protein